MAGSAAVAVAAPPGTVTACDPAGDFPLSYDDVDADGIPDVVAGVPGVTSAVAGTVDVHATRNPSHNIVGAPWPQLGISSRFGQAIAEVDIDSDGCSDLAVGDPGHAGGGAVDLLFGTQNGIRTTSPVQIPARTATDEYGTAVSVGRSMRNGRSVTDLWIGAPGRTVNGVADAGAVDHYTLSPSGTATFVESLTESSPVIGGRPVTNERFGAVIDADADAVLVGLPAATVNGQANAGAAVWLVVGGSTDAVTQSQTLTQDSPGVPGAAEVGDRFGASVVANADVIAVGVPDEDLGTIVNAGLVQTFVRASGGTLDPGAEISQSTAGVPGTSEAGDYFGWALAANDMGSSQALWIGVPGEDLGTQSDAGDVTVRWTTKQGSSTTTSYTLLRQGPGGVLSGSYAAGNEVGWALGETTGRFVGDPDFFNGLVDIGVPGATVGGVAHAGQIVRAYVVPGNPSIGSLGSLSFSGTALPSQRFGSVIAQPVDSNAFQ